MTEFMMLGQGQGQCHFSEVKVIDQDISREAPKLLPPWYENDSK